MHLPYPSVAQAQAEIAACTDGSMPLEPYQLISQYTLEPLLKSVAETLPSVDVRYGCEFISPSSRMPPACARRSRRGSATSELTAQYLVGCDGGSEQCAPPTRHQAAAATPICCNCGRRCTAATICSSAFRSAKGRHYHVADAHNSTFLIVQDSTRHFTLHSVVDSDDEMKTMFEQVVAMPVKYEMLSCAPWRQNLLLADSYGQGRVFLAGDAVHLVIPTGGLGMNSGVGDAIDLSWKLAATLQGLGRAEAARVVRDRASADRRAQCRSLAPRLARAARLARGLSSRIFATRRRKAPRPAPIWRAIADVEQRKSNEMIGAELGYRYAGLPDHLAGSGRGAAGPIS